MLKLVLNTLGLKRLEPYDRKLSRTVLRGLKRWQHLFFYPTLVWYYVEDEFNAGLRSDMYDKCACYCC
jgi:hypothetical protein